MGPKWAPFVTLFWAASCATASSHSCGSDRQIRPTDTQGRGNPRVYHAPNLITTRAFPLPFAPSPSSNGRLYHHHGETKKTRLRSCSLAPNPTVTREWSTERKTAL